MVVGASLAIHVGLIVFLTQVPAGKRIAARIIPVELVERKKPPPPKPRPRRLPPPRPQEPKQPRTTAPPRTQPAAPSDSADGDTFGVAPDDGGAGTMVVPVGRTLEAPATASAPVGPPPAPLPLVLELADDLPVVSLEREPEPIGLLRAVYPEVPRLAGATGSALVEAFVDAEGLVSRAVLLASTAPAFGKSALEAVRQTRFSPAIRSGVAVSRSIRIPVLFDLAGGTAVVSVASGSIGAGEVEHATDVQAPDVQVQAPDVQAPDLQAPGEPLVNVRSTTSMDPEPATGSVKVPPP